MVRVTLVQFEAGTCNTPLLSRSKSDLVIYPVSICPPPPGYTALLPRGDHAVLYDGGVRHEVVCGDVLVYKGLRLLLLCELNPCLECNGVDAIIAPLPLWAKHGEAKREASRVKHLLMTLSYRCDAPVLYVNAWGVIGSRVYLGSSGVYDFEKGEPLTLGWFGDGVFTATL